MKCGMIISALVTATLLLAACTIDPPLHLRQSMDVVVKVLWKAEVHPDGIKPDGMSLFFFRNGDFYLQHTTADVDSCSVPLEPGKYRIFMISLSPDEYGGMHFFDMHDFDNAYVQLADTWSDWYHPAEGETLVKEPELMTVGVSDEFEISEEMIQEWLKNNPGFATPGTDVNIFTVTVPVYPRNVVSMLWATIYSDNADVLKAVRASITGMARNFLLTQDRTGDQEGTQLLENWSLTIVNPEARIGHLDCKVNTFGLPRGEMPSPLREPTLNLATLLIDNATVDQYTFFVGDKFRLEEPIPLGYRLLYHLIIGTEFEPAMHPPDVKPADQGGESGFAADVEDWEEGDILDIMM